MFDLSRLGLSLGLAVFLSLCGDQRVQSAIIVAEGEKFQPLDDKGWKPTGQNNSYGSHTYGGMWMTHGGCLAAPETSVDSVARHPITVTEAGKYRVWSKYQAPPYFHYLHRVEVHQNGKVVFSHVYGKRGTDRLWSFSGVSDELWWPWGVDHDCAEAPKTTADLVAGPAEIRLITVAGEKPMGARCVDFVLLTTHLEDNYQGFKPYAVGTPFAFEALAATQLYVRFQHNAKSASQLSVSRAGHFQPNYGGATTKIPAKPVAANTWSEWVNIGPFCRLVHDEGLTLQIAPEVELHVQFARDAEGKDLVGDLKLKSGETAYVPIDITWNRQATVKSSQQHAREILAESTKWRRANDGKKPKYIHFYGAFNGQEEWVHELKDRLGYNTTLPDKYEHLPRDRVFAHASSIAAIEALARTTKERDRLSVISFGDEIGLGKINFKDPKLNEKFRDWLKAKNISEKDLGVPLAEARLTDTGSGRLIWYSNLFNEEERFGAFREMTERVKTAFGPEVLTGANYSPHHLALYYGPVYQWVDIFKYRGMTMLWAEDYIFSVPEVPQIISWSFAQLRCGAKYHDMPIHYYVMPHAPGQEPDFLRRNLLTTVGYGAKHVDNFWVAPPERFTENYVGWTYRATYRTLSEAIFDTAEAERFLKGGKVRPARVAVVTGKATDFHESRLMVDKAKDFFTAQCKNAPAQVNQILCRKEQQMLYLALRQAGHAVDVITEDDMVERNELANYDVVYFAGEWADRRAVQKLASWIEAGGVLFASAGLGHRNEFDESDAGMPQLLGIQVQAPVKNLAVLRTLLELPFAPALDEMTYADGKIPAIGMKQTLQPLQGTEVLARWSDGSAAATRRKLGKGQAIAVGTLIGNAWMRSAVRPIPWARGGRKSLYNPTNFDPKATQLVRLGLEAAKPLQAVETSVEGVEAIVMDHPTQGTLVTLVNWTNAPIKGLKLKIRTSFEPLEARSVEQQRAVDFKFQGGTLTNRGGIATVTLDLNEADFLLLPK